MHNGNNFNKKAYLIVFGEIEVARLALIALLAFDVLFADAVSACGVTTAVVVERTGDVAATVPRTRTLLDNLFLASKEKAVAHSRRVFLMEDLIFTKLTFL